MSQLPAPSPPLRRLGSAEAGESISVSALSPRPLDRLFVTDLLLPLGCIPCSNLPHYLLAYHQTVLLPAALEPDAFPAETLDNAMHVLLGTWLDELGEPTTACSIPRWLPAVC